MVAKIERSDGFCAQLQVLHCAFYSNDDDSEPAKGYLDGRILRKDGTLGIKRAGIGFDCARIQRRMLNGHWVTLTPKEVIEITA